MGQITGIYIIQSICIPQRVYVGSAFNISSRWVSHRSRLKKGEHSSVKLQRHYEHYGLDDLVFEILEEGLYISKQHLRAREQGWFSHYKYKETNIPYFNVSSIAGSCSGDDVSKETRAKISAAKKGIKIGPMSQEIKDKISKTLKGRVVSSETKKKLSIAAKNRPPLTEKQKKHISDVKKGLIPNRFGEWHIDEVNAFKGKHHTEESKQKQREARIGVPPSNKGVSPSAETYAKISKTFFKKGHSFPSWNKGKRYKIINRKAVFIIEKKDDISNNTL